MEPGFPAGRTRMRRNLLNEGAYAMRDFRLPCGTHARLPEEEASIGANGMLGSADSTRGKIKIHKK